MNALTFRIGLPRLAFAKVFGAIMPRAYMSGFGAVSYEKVEEPKPHGDAQKQGEWVMVKPKLAGVCGSDVMQVFLEAAADHPLSAVVSAPHVMGHEVVVKTSTKAACTASSTIHVCAEKEVDPTPMITHHFPLDRYREAFVAARDKRRHGSREGDVRFRKRVSSVEAGIEDHRRTVLARERVTHADLFVAAPAAARERRARRFAFVVVLALKNARGTAIVRRRCVDDDDVFDGHVLDGHVFDGHVLDGDVFDRRVFDGHVRRGVVLLCHVREAAVRFLDALG